MPSIGASKAKASIPVEAVPAVPVEGDGKLTLIPITPRARNVLIAVALLGLAFLLWRAQGVVSLLIAGGALAVVMSYPVRALSKIMPRGLAMLTVILGALLLFAIALVVLIPIAAAQLGDLIQRLPTFATEADKLLHVVLDQLSKRGLLQGTPEAAFNELQKEAVGRFNGVAQGVLGGVFNSLSGVLGKVFQVFSIILVAVYLLADSDRIRSLFVRLWPPVYQDDATELWNDVGGNLSKYLGGVLVSMSFQGAVVSVALYLLHVPYALLLGIWTAVAAIIPVIGSYFGAIPAMVAGFFVSPLTAVLVGVTFFVVNMIDGNVIAPRVQGKALNVAPLLIFLSVIAGGEIAGLTGALLAVPVLAIVRAVWVFLDERLVVRKDAHEVRAMAKATTNITVAGADEDHDGIPDSTPTVSVEVSSSQTRGRKPTQTVRVTKDGETVAEG